MNLLDRESPEFNAAADLQTQSRAWTIAARGAWSDQRLQQRCAQILGTLFQTPGTSFPQAFGTWANLKGFYRFMDNPRVGQDQLRHMVEDDGLAACAGQEVVYCPADTTTIDLSRQRKNQQAGPINENPKSKGYFIHAALAFTGSGAPLGVVNLHVWTRPKTRRALTKRQEQLRPIAEKESFKWVRVMRQTSARLRALYGARAPRQVYIFDCEGDIAEVFAEAGADPKLGFIIRAYHDRRVKSQQHQLKATLKAQPPAGSWTITVPARPARGKQPARPERQAAVSIRFCSQLNLAAHPRSVGGRRPLITVAAVAVIEDNPPPDLPPDDRVAWYLLTTEAVTTLEEAVRIVDRYALRWRCEELHLTVKSGYLIEARQFATVTRAAKSAILLVQAAFEILRLRHLSRTMPHRLAAEFFSPVECQVLAHLAAAPVESPARLTVAAALQVIARLGGHLGRRRDGPAGVRTLWKGWRLVQLVVAYELRRQESG